MYVHAYASNQSGKKFTESEQKKIREYPQSVVKHIQKHDVKNLLKDEYFLTELTKELKNKSSTTEEKVYFFYLMMQKINWAFCGGISIPYPFSYADYSLMQISTLFEYRMQLSSLEIDSKPFFELAFKDTDSKPILASYSFLLGSLLEPDEATIYNVCNSAYENKFFEKQSLFRAMLIHNMMLVSPVMVFITKKENSKEFSDFLLLTQSIFEYCDCKEEEKEDLLLSVFYDENFNSVLMNRLIDEKKDSDNFFVLTCATLAKKRSRTKESFSEFIDVWEKHETEDWKKKLISKIKSDDYNVDYYGMPLSEGQSFIKVWDDISLVIYQNGKLFVYDDYSEFLPDNN